LATIANFTFHNDTAVAPVIIAQDLYPSLEDRELGEPYEPEGERIIYERALYERIRDNRYL